jgi:hypothetical protein
MGKRKTRRPRAAKRVGPKRAAKRAAAKRTTRKTSHKRGAAPRGKAKKPPRAAARRKPAREKESTSVRRRPIESEEERGEVVPLLHELEEHHATGPAATGGDVDADWQRAQSSGEETVGGSVSTPDQDRVDEIGHALGVEQPTEAPLRPTEEILEERDRRYWELERRAEKRADRRQEP